MTVNVNTESYISERQNQNRRWFAGMGMWGDGGRGKGREGGGGEGVELTVYKIKIKSAIKSLAEIGRKIWLDRKSRRN